MPEPLLRVFLSATSRDLLSSREIAARALRIANIWPDYQEEFTADYRSLKEYLCDAISRCDAVICLVGEVYGAAPQEFDGPPRSYTQIEYDMAAKLEKPIFVLLTHETFAPDKPSIDIPAERAFQQCHRLALQQSHKCEWVTSPADVELKVTRLIPRLLELGNRLSMLMLHPPPSPTYFVGRVEELAQLAEAARRRTPAIIAVIGMGGQGKTTLVREWLQRQKGLTFTAGFWCTAYRNGFTFDSFLDEMLHYLTRGRFDKRELPDVAARVTYLLTLLQERPVLVVIDGFERWLRGWNTGTEHRQAAETSAQREGFFEGVDDFLGQVSGLGNGTHLIVTSRALPAALDFAARSVIPVEAENPFDLSLKGLAPAAAVELLQKYGVKGTPEQIEQTAAVYAYHPFALNLLGGLLKKHAGRLERRPKSDDLTPLRALHELFEETRRNLPGREQADRFLARAALALESLSLVTLADVWGDDREPTPDADALLDMAVTLAEWNLVEWDGENERVNLHPLVRQYYGWLVGGEETSRLHRRFLQWYRERPLPGDAVTLEQMRPRVLAIEHARRAGEHQTAFQLLYAPATPAHAFVEWLVAWGHLTRGTDLLGALIETLSGSECAQLLSTRAAFYRRLGQFAAARRDLDEAIALLNRKQPTLSTGELSSLAGAWMNRGIVRQSQGDPLPVSDFNKALEVLDEIKDPGYFLYRSLFGNQVRMNRANVLEDAGHYREALADHNQIVDLYRQLIDVGMTEHVALLAKALGNRGNVHADLMLSDQAIADYDGAIVLYEDLTRLGRLDVRPDLLHVRLVRAATLSEAGRAGEARDALDDCLHAYTQLLNQGRSDLEAEAALAWMNRALACLLLGKPAEALADADRAVVAYRQLEHSGRADLVGYRAHAQMIRAAARFGCHDRSGEATDRAEGIATFQQLIAAGQKALRFVFVRKVIVAARYLTPGAQPEASALLAAALTELETAVREGQAVEAMRLEARRGLKEICHVAERFDKDLFDRLIAFAELA